MSRDYDEFGSNSQPSEEQFMKINDYDEDKEDSYNNSDVQQTRLEELEKIVSRHQAQNSSKVAKLQGKLSQMQQKCQKLLKTNSLLTRRIEQMHMQYQQQAQSQLDLGQLQQLMSQIQKQLQIYRKEWQKFKEKQANSNSKRLSQFLQLSQTIQNQKQEILLLKAQKSQILQSKNNLQRNCRSLELQVQNLQRELKDEKANKYQAKPRHFSRHTASTFEDEVQAQLQQLIQKLMSQLQFERHSHKKSMGQIKSMQQEILQLQREIAAKNDKIYELEMDNLKGYRNGNKNAKQRAFDNERSNYDHSENYKSKSDRSTNNVLKSFTIQQMLSGAVDLSERERYIVASKLIQFYLKKIEANDLVPHNSDKLKITNFNKINPTLITIRKSPSSPYKGQLSLRTLGWNLGAILSSLLIEWREDLQYQDQNDQFIGTTIESLLREQLSDINELYSLKSVVDQVTKISR